MSDQLWAWVFVMTGCVMAIVCHHFGIAADIGAGIIGAGINALTKAETHKQTMNVQRIDSITQNEVQPDQKKV